MVYSYKRLRLLQPHIRSTEIYKKGDEYFIQCSNFESFSIDGEGISIDEVFDREIRIVECPVSISKEIPEDALKIKERSISEIISLKGNPFNEIELNKQLSLLVPKHFPDFWLEYNYDKGSFYLRINKEVSNDQKKAFLGHIYKLQGNKTKVEIICDQSLKVNLKENKYDPMSISVRFLSNLMEKWEFGEQLWADNKEKLFTEPIKETTNTFDKRKRTECLINGQMPTAYNIRNYLTLFDELQIILPIESRCLEFSKAMDITKKELIQLVELGKLSFLLPHSVHRYKWIGERVIPYMELYA